MDLSSTKPLPDKLTVVLSPEHNLYHSGYLISAAAAAGAKFRVAGEVHPLVPRLQTNGLILAVDLLDSSTTYHRPSLDACDYYFKRSYVREAVPQDFGSRVLPFGLNYACRTWVALRVAASLFLKGTLAPDNPSSFLRSPLPSLFEAPPTDKPDLRILFNTRLWPREQLAETDNPEVINGFRIDLVRALRQTFGARFAGGIIRSSDTLLAYPHLEEYPELIVNTPYRRGAYARFSRGPAVGIYTRGLHGSNAFKAAEYLASSKCLIGESLCHDLPETLGDSHRVSHTVEGIVSECDRVLTNITELIEMRKMSWDYYVRNIRYDRRLALLLGTITN